MAFPQVAGDSTLPLRIHALSQGLPLPLPTKWHLQFLPAINLHERYGPEAAQNPAIIREISSDVRRQMQEAMDAAIVSSRRSLFWRSVFQLEEEL